MIKYTTGNLLISEAEALVNTVNTVGIMGKGIALQFKKMYPENFKAYARACRRGEVETGKMFVFETGRLTSPKYIINFPTKKHWKEKTKLEYVTEGLKDLIRVVKSLKVKSLAIPPLGCGNGGLAWSLVKNEIEKAFKDLDDVEILLFEPTGAPLPEQQPVASNKPEMSPIIAAIMDLLDNYLIPDYRSTMLELQKLTYFLQEAGEKRLRLTFVEKDYGPYANNLNHLVQKFDGYYIRGYGDRTIQPRMEPVPEAMNCARELLNKEEKTKSHIQRVVNLIEGFETPYGMELLSSVHWVVTRNKEISEVEEAAEAVWNWNDHKRKTFSKKHIETAWTQLREQGWI